MPPKRKRNSVPDSIREKIVDLVLHGGHTKAEVAKRYDYPYTTVDSIVKKFEITGETAAQRKKGGAHRGSQLGEQELGLMLHYIAEHPNATINEVKNHIRNERGLSLSVSMVQRCLRDRLHLTLKRINVEHDRHNSAEAITNRQQWTQALRARGELLDEAVFLDAANFHLQQTRSLGRARAGDGATQSEAPYKAQNLSVLVAVDRHGIQARLVKTGVWNAQSFLTFLQEEVFPVLQGQRRTILLDNVRFYHITEVVSAIQNAGHQPLFLPPYTPWFNVAERVFGKIKPYVSRRNLRETDDIRQVIDQQLSTITPESCVGWIHECHCWMMVAEAGHPLGPEHDAATAVLRHGLVAEP